MDHGGGQDNRTYLPANFCYRHRKKPEVFCPVEVSRLTQLVPNLEMNSIALSHLQLLTFPSSPLRLKSRARFLSQGSRFHLSCSSSQRNSAGELNSVTKSEYKPYWFDYLFLNLFRKKMVEVVGWDSKKPGYDGLIEVANRLMMIGSTNSETSEAAVRILRSLFPPLLLDLYRLLITPIGEGKFAAIMVARVTAVSCRWLMGWCKVNSISLPDGSVCESGVLVEKCKYLEESKCVGICVNTCKLPTQAFFKDYMGIPLFMEPDFSDYSCQFNFGVPAPLPESDSTLLEPCLEICPIAKQQIDVTRLRKSVSTNAAQCPRSP